MSYKRIKEALRKTKDKEELRRFFQEELGEHDIVIDSAAYTGEHYLSVSIGLPSQKYGVLQRKEPDVPHLIADISEIVPVIVLFIQQDQKWIKLGAFQHFHYGSIFLGFHEFTLERLALAYYKSMALWRRMHDVFVNVLEKQFPFYIDWRTFLLHETGLRTPEDFIPPDRDIRSKAYHHLLLATRSLFNSVLTKKQAEHQVVRQFLGWLETLYMESTFCETGLSEIEAESAA